MSTKSLTMRVTRSRKAQPSSDVPSPSKLTPTKASTPPANANVTPTKATTTRAQASATPMSASIDAQSPRKSHRCQYCKQPRSGHPRSGCPNVDPPIPPTEHKAPVDENMLADALQGMRLTSLNTTSKGSRRRSAARDIRVENTGDAVSPSGRLANKTISRQVKSSALIAPTSDGERTTPAAEEHRSPGQSRPLAPTLSQQETQLFLDRAKSTAQGHATILKHSVSGLADLIAGAEARGLKVHIIPSAETSGDTDTALVVIAKDEELVQAVGHVGVRDKAVVDKAFEREVRRGYHPALLTGGGFAVGAVVTFTGLAFS